MAVDTNKTALKIIVGYLAIYLIVFVVVGFIYSDSDEMPVDFENFTSGKAPGSLSSIPILGDFVHFFGKIWDLINIFLVMLTFQLPHVPLELSVVFTIVNVVALLLFILAIYPYISDVIEKIGNFMSKIAGAVGGAV